MNFNLREKNWAYLLVLLVVIVGIGTFINSSFLKISNLLSIIRSYSIFGVLAIGVAVVLLTGEFDLSVGSILSLSAVLGGQLAFMGNSFLVLVVTLLVGLVLGLINAYLVTKANIPSLIVTLATLIIYAAAAAWISQGQAIYPYGLNKYLWMGKGSIGIVPVPALIFMSVALLMTIILKTTKFGKKMYAVGSSEPAGWLAGLSVDRIKASAFVISGVLAALAAPMTSGRYNRIWPAQGDGMELTALAIAVLGGISLEGGKGNIGSVALAALVYGGIIRIIELAGFGTYVANLFTGSLLIFAVGLMRYSKQN